MLLALAGQPAPSPEAVAIAAGAGLAEMVGFRRVLPQPRHRPDERGTDAASDSGGVAWTVAVNRSTSFAALALVVLVGRRGLSYRSADLRPAAINRPARRRRQRLVRARAHARDDEHRPRALQALGVVGVLVGIGLVTAWGEA